MIYGINYINWRALERLLWHKRAMKAHISDCIFAQSDLSLHWRLKNHWIL